MDERDGEGSGRRSEGTRARVLLADDDATTRELVAEALRDTGFDVVTAEGGQEAVARFADGGFDAVVLDAIMPRVSGIEAARTIKAIRGDDVVPVIVLHAKSDVDSKVAALEIGADGTLVKPLEHDELTRAVATAVRIRRARATLTAARRALDEARSVDPETGARSFADLATRLDTELGRAERHSDPLACCVLDVDGLKVHNERGGRSFGDAVLRRVADVVRGALRESDVVARYGGSGLFVMLPATHFAGAVVVATRVWRDVAAVTMTTPSGIDLRVTASVGLALFPSRDVRTRRALVAAAETALAEAKRRGGNRLCVFQQSGAILAADEAASSVRGDVGPATVQADPGQPRPRP